MNEYLITINTALWLGILTSISPCPLATNLAAVTFISKKFSSRTAIAINGLLYTLGRTLTYFIVSFVIISGLFSIPSVSAFLQNYMTKILGPLLIIAGMFLLELINLPSFGNACWRIHARLANKGYIGSFVLGSLFAVAFCPSSAALFFGALIPLALGKGSNILMPVTYGIGTGLPVIIFATLIAFGFAGIGRAFHNVAKLEIWVRRITGVLFILVGLYYIFTYIFGVNI